MGSKLSKASGETEEHRVATAMEERGEANKGGDDEGRDLAPPEKENDVWELPPWEDDFEAIAFYEQFERRPPTEAEVQRMDRNLAKLTEAMAATRARWQLDGALNISLYNGGRYIGVHKDVDISVEPDDLASFEADMLKKGYAFFETLPNPDGKSPRKIKRVTAKDILSEKVGHSLSLTRIDEGGRVITNEELNAFDLHIIRRNSDGQPLGKKGVPLPEKWFHPTRLRMNKGEEINASNPAQLLYYKLHQGREYDYTDLDRFVETGALSVEDTDDVLHVLAQEHEAEIGRIDKIISPIAEEIAHAKDDDGILTAFRKSPEIGQDVDDPSKNERLHRLAECFLQAKDKSKEGLVREVASLMGIENQYKRNVSNLSHLRARISDRGKIQDLRKELEVATRNNN